MTRRIHDETLAVRRAWPIFLWRRCWICQMEVRREWLWWMAWRIASEPCTYLHPIEVVICRHCAPNRASAFDLAKDLMKGE